MQSEKKPFDKSLTRLIYCAFITIMLGRSITFCQVEDDLESLIDDKNPVYAAADPGPVFSPDLLEADQLEFDTPLASADPQNPPGVPVPPAGLTVLVFGGVMVVGWLRRRTPS